MAAHDRAERLAATAELRRRLVAVASATGALLGVHLLGRRGHFAACLGLVRAALAVRQLPHHATMKDVLADGDGEHRIGEIDLAGTAALDGFDRDLHDSILAAQAAGPAASAAGGAAASAAGAAASAALRRPAGYGASLGR